ncbi:hypothetical protein NP233_g7772 [Leucocoprinus birnbaumii]|uniref:Uncharacterized protein n=1 Tax=Leucocoprinus birnbaumii TaxID=56174 RepID=A0AAD5VR93_9AGAR|nr:hypothetical protein NP233_g7772 [Leucocoprinus birnbaumii]
MTESAYWGVSLRYRAPWTLTALHLERMPMDTSLKVLCRCPNIVELKLGPEEGAHTVDPDLDALQTWFGGDLVFKRLEVFKWYYPAQDYTWEWMETFVQQVRMPVLHTLSIITVEMDDPPVGEIGPLCQQLSATVKTLRLHGVVGFPRSSYPHFLASNSALESLTISRYELETIANITDSLLLIPYGPSKLPAPKLQSLVLDGKCAVWRGQGRNRVFNEIDSLEPPQFEALVTMLERRLARGDTFRLEFAGIFPEWSYSIQARLRKLVKEDVKLVIIEASRPVDWLADAVE